jgi:hypothetical protein
MSKRKKQSMRGRYTPPRPRLSGRGRGLKAEMVAELLKPPTFVARQLDGTSF